MLAHQPQVAKVLGPVAVHKLTHEATTISHATGNLARTVPGVHVLERRTAAICRSRDRVCAQIEFFDKVGAGDAQPPGQVWVPYHPAIPHMPARAVSRGATWGFAPPPPVPAPYRIPRAPPPPEPTTPPAAPPSPSMQPRPGPVDLEADEQRADDDEEQHLAALRAEEESARAEYTRLYRLRGFMLPAELEPQLAAAEQRVSEAAAQFGVAWHRVCEAAEAAVSAVVTL